jgi:hypothetical protein
MAFLSPRGHRFFISTVTGIDTPRAQRLLHDDPAAATKALIAAGIAAPSSKHLEKIVSLYRDAVPRTPHVSADAVERNAKLYPARPTMPDFSKVKASDYVNTSFIKPR